jgi:hypothetical protein
VPSIDGRTAGAGAGIVREIHAFERHRFTGNRRRTADGERQGVVAGRLKRQALAGIRLQRRDPGGFDVPEVRRLDGPALAPVRDRRGGQLQPFGLCQCAVPLEALGPGVQHSDNAAVLAAHVAVEQRLASDQRNRKRQSAVLRCKARQGRVDAPLEAEVEAPVQLEIRRDGGWRKGGGSVGAARRRKALELQRVAAQLTVPLAEHAPAAEV